MCEDLGGFQQQAGCTPPKRPTHTHTHTLSIYQRPQDVVYILNDTKISYPTLDVYTHMSVYVFVRACLCVCVCACVCVC